MNPTYSNPFCLIPAIVIGGQMAGAIGVTLGFLLVDFLTPFRITS
ncbi:hypothetical protein ACLK17_12555 [Escherichia coli]